MRENGGDDPKIIEFNTKGKKQAKSLRSLDEASLNKEKNAENIYLQAEDFHNKGEYSVALNLYKEAFLLNPNLWQAGVNSASILILEKKYPAALIMLRRVYAVEPQQAVVYHQFALAYEGIKDYNQAIESYEKALLLSSNDPDILYNYAELLFKRHQTNFALEYFQKYINLNPVRDEYYEHALKRINHLTKAKIKKSGLKVVKKKS